MKPLGPINSKNRADRFSWGYPLIKTVCERTIGQIKNYLNINSSHIRNTTCWCFTIN
jgi:hypothetical protein